MTTPLPPSPDAPLLYTREEARQKLRLSVRAFKKAVALGKIRTIRISEKVIMVPRGALEELAR